MGYPPSGFTLSPICPGADVAIRLSDRVSDLESSVGDQSFVYNLRECRQALVILTNAVHIPQSALCMRLLPQSISCKINFHLRLYSKETEIDSPIRFVSRFYLSKNNMFISLISYFLILC